MKAIDEVLKGCEHDGSYIPVNDVIRCMQEYARQFTPKWIKVTDRLPEIGQMILVYVSSIDMICRDQYRHFEGINKNSFVYKGVTHWMPLPEKPEV